MAMLAEMHLQGSPVADAKLFSHHLYHLWRCVSGSMAFSLRAASEANEE